MYIHRIIEWLCLEGTPGHGQECHPLDQVAKGLVQPNLQHLQRWGNHNFSGQPVPMCSLSEECPPNI